MKFGKILPLALGFLPLVASAQGFDSLQESFNTILDFINDYIIPLIFALAVLYFLWGVLSYVRAGGDEGARKEGRNMMVWGIVAIFVMVSVWGLVGVLQNTFDLNTTGIPELPVVPDVR